MVERVELGAYKGKGKDITEKVRGLKKEMEHTVCTVPLASTVHLENGGQEGIGHVT